MLFNSFSYFLFIPLVFIVYWSLNKKLQSQNLIILIASYIFYACWDYRFLALIFISTIIDYCVGILISNEQKLNRRKFWLIISLLINLSFLGFFKYYNFFIDSWIELNSSLGLKSHVSTLNIILPVGISFYTFQTLSYTIDVYNKRINPTKDFIAFGAFVSFFPQLVAGPIERASNLLPQFSKIKKFDFKYARSGVELIIWGLFQKIVIADNCATFVNTIFENHTKMNSLSLALGAFYFSFQIYGDFAGYSNIAIGSARLLGFDLMRNFNYPYFSKNLGEFWRRWHISLSTWFRDYVFIPLGGSKINKLTSLRNIFVVFLISGLWHGANWTYIFWGGLHAIFYTPLIFYNKKSPCINESRRLPDFFKIIFTFSVVCFAWIFFRSPTISYSYMFLTRMFTDLNFSIQYLSIERYNVEMLLLIFGFIVTEWFSRNYEHPIFGKYRFIKTIFILSLILIFGVFSQHSEFIYFQF